MALLRRHPLNRAALVSMQDLGLILPQAGGVGSPSSVGAPTQHSNGLKGWKHVFPGTSACVFVTFFGDGE